MGTTLQQNVSSQQITSQSESRVSTEQNEPKPQTVIQQPASTQPTSLLGGGNKVVMRESGYQKHSVKSMANRFATFQPKTEIPLNILPDLRNFNGQEGPKLNYLSNNSTQGRVTPAATKRVGDQKDFESSRLAYEQKRTQQNKQNTVQQSTGNSASFLRNNVLATPISNQQRFSMSSVLSMGSSIQTSSLNLVDPSSLLRGEKLTTFAEAPNSPYLMRKETRPMSCMLPESKPPLLPMMGATQATPMMRKETRPMSCMLPESKAPVVNMMNSSQSSQFNTLTQHNASEKRYTPLIGQELPSLPKKNAAEPLSHINNTSSNERTLSENKAFIERLGQNSTLNTLSTQPMNVSVNKISEENKSYVEKLETFSSSNDFQATVKTCEKKFESQTQSDNSSIPSIRVDEESTQHTSLFSQQTCQQSQQQAH